MSDFRMSFDPLFSWGVICAIALSCFALFFWFELKRHQRLLIPRMMALILIFISILALLSRPYFKKEKLQAILLTQGFERTKVDSVLRVEPQLRIFRFQNTESYPYSEILSSTQRLSDENVKYIFGAGLPTYISQLIPQKNFKFFPGRTPFGVVELTVPKIIANRKNPISGVCVSRGKTKLKLAGPSGSEDSIYLKDGKNKFTLSFRPKQPGLFIYSLLTQDSLGNNLSERLPIEVVQETPLRILFLQRFPTAEVRYLKNFLAEKGHSIVVRSQTSKNNFNEEFINSSKIRLNQLSEDLLNRFDLVLADSKTIDELTPFEKSNLKKTIAGGLGLVVLQNDFTTKSEFYLARGEKISIDTVHIHLTGKDYTLSASPIKVISKPSVESIIKVRDRVLAGSQFLGAGKITFQFLQETYRMALEGNAEDYTSIWTPMIEKTARRENQKFKLKLTSQFPIYQNEPVELSVLSSGESPRVYCDSIRLAVIENAVVDDSWSARSWMHKSGWHKFIAGDSSELNFYISEPSEWQSLRAANQMRETPMQNEFAAKSVNPKFENERVWPLLFFIVFILASGFLWLAPKI